jgi:hypothetical protein
MGSEKSAATSDDDDDEDEEDDEDEDEDEDDAAKSSSTGTLTRNGIPPSMRCSNTKFGDARLSASANDDDDDDDDEEDDSAAAGASDTLTRVATEHGARQFGHSLERERQSMMHLRQKRWAHGVSVGWSCGSRQIVHVDALMSMAAPA